jgi:hypothetical protein
VSMLDQGTHFFFLTMQNGDEVRNFYGTITPPGTWTRRDFYESLVQGFRTQNPGWDKAVPVSFLVNLNSI